jgi:GT2 family glycosyltransferase
MGLPEMLGLVWSRRPKKLFDIALAAAFGYVAEAENALDWAIGAEPLEDFPQWRLRRERPLDLTGVDETRSDWGQGPSYLVLIEARTAPKEAVARTIESLRAQIYEKFSAVVIGGGELRAQIAREDDARLSLFDDAKPDALRLQRDRFVLFLRAGDALVPNALALVTEELARLPATKLLYGDELIADGAGVTPLFKPDWSPRFDAGRPYLGRSLFLAAAALSQKALPRDEADFQHRAREVASGLAKGEIAHLRRWLVTRGADAPATVEPPRAALAASAASAPPSVSIVMLTKDRADLLGPCLDSILTLSTHPRFEVVVVDNGTRQAEALAILDRAAQDARVKVLRRPGPFHFAAMNNEAARHATGDVLVFLNNDTAVLSPNWLERLSEEAVRPETGAVGCLLLYPDGRVQHSGVVVGVGQDAGHFESLQAPDAPSWLDVSRSLREVSAVTAACLAVAREKFFSVGGLDEVNLPVEFNDIDLCLRLGQKGWTTCYAPDVRLLHKESASRGGAAARPLSKYAKERNCFRGRWRGVIRDDPYFHPGFSLYARKAALS